MNSSTKTIVSILLSVVGLCSVSKPSVRPVAEGSQTKGLTNPFFAMDTATDRKASPKAQAEMVNELGYAGIGCDIKAMPDMLKAVDDCGTKLFTVYVGANVDPAKPKYDPQLKDVLKSLKGRDTIIWLFITGAKPSNADRDEQAVAIVQEVADLAADSGLRLALYPHTGFYVERVEDALRVMKKANRKNVGVTFNLCHWLRVDKEENMVPLLQLALPHLFVVTINGADSGGKNWDTLIQTLDRGTFDNYKFLKTLRDLGYTGPIGFQGYAIKGDARDNLKRTIAAWRILSARIASEQKQ